jgi:hypothetical protein
MVLRLNTKKSKVSRKNRTIKNKHKNKVKAQHSKNNTRRIRGGAWNDKTSIATLLTQIEYVKNDKEYSKNENYVTQRCKDIIDSFLEEHNIKFDNDNKKKQELIDTILYVTDQSNFNTNYKKTRIINILTEIKPDLEIRSDSHNAETVNSSGFVRSNSSLENQN